MGKLEDFGVTVPRVMEFRVYADRGRRYYFDVFVFKNRRDMRRFWQQTNDRTGLRGSSRFEAVCRMLEVIKKNGRPVGLLGQVLFHTKRIGAGIVSHEMTHATLHWAHKRQVFPAPGSRAEERFCWVQGYLTNQFWNEYFRRGGARLG